MKKQQGETTIFFSRLSELCDEQGKAVATVCGELGIPSSSPTQWKNDRRYPKAETLIKLAQGLNTTTDYLLGLTKIKKPIVRDDELNDDILELINMFQAMDEDKVQALRAFLALQ